MEAVPAEPFEAWLRATVEDVSGEVVVEPLTGGASNLTFLVHDDRHQWVLRRPPLGPVLATASDMVREHTVQRAVATTAVPVPGVVAWCDDDSVIGAPFYVMDWLDGAVYSDADSASHLTETQARDASYELVDVLARLHAIDPTAIGLSELGRPSGFLERQLRRWSTQWERSSERELSAVDKTLARLADKLPAHRRPAIVHGDYSFNNAMYANEEPTRIVAVLDWELSTLGDPLTDLGMLLAYWGEAGELVWRDRAPQAHRGGSGYPDADKLAERYATRTGDDLAEIDFYRALATLKLAVICEGAVRRVAVTSPERARRTAETVDSLAHLALRTVTR